MPKTKKRGAASSSVDGSSSDRPTAAKKSKKVADESLGDTNNLHDTKRPVAQAIPKSWVEATTTDRLLFQWRDEGNGMAWKKISDELFKVTGVRSLPDTLRKRYLRIKVPTTQHTSSS